MRIRLKSSITLRLVIIALMSKKEVVRRRLGIDKNKFNVIYVICIDLDVLFKGGRTFK